MIGDTQILGCEEKKQANSLRLFHLGCAAGINNHRKEWGIWPQKGTRGEFCLADSFCGFCARLWLELINPSPCNMTDE